MQSFFGVDWNDALDTEEVNAYLSLPTLPYGTPPPSTPSTEISIEKVPRIIHQTWKTTLLPTKWAKLTTQCKALHPDYEYKLWTDESSIEFIKEFYPWFLPTFMNYNLNIQRADVIRYFVLHKYGGVYMDLDIGESSLFCPSRAFVLCFNWHVPRASEQSLWPETQQNIIMGDIEIMILIMCFASLH